LALAPQDAGVRRLLADVLAQQGNDAAWEEAQQLLGKTAESGTSVDDLRLRAALLTRRNRPGDARAARELLERLVQDPDRVRPNDRLSLATLYAAAGDRRAAHGQYLALVEGPGAQVDHMVAFVEFLLEGNQLQQAARWLERLRQIEPDSVRTMRLHTRWLHASGQLDAVIEKAESFAEQGWAARADDPEQQARFGREIANLYVVVEQSASAERWYRRALEKDPREFTTLARFLAREGRTAAAVDVCLDARTQDATVAPVVVLAEVLLLSEPHAADEQRAEPIFAEGLQQFPRDARLLYTVGNLRLRQERFDEAIDLLERATRWDPGNYMAWNNLAAVLAERPGEQERALQYIARGIQSAGRPLPLLLDTKAAALLHAGKTAEAAALLETIVQSGDQDPRFYFHLSVAYDKLGQVDKAREALTQAQQLGLANTYLSQLERDQLAGLGARLDL
jgi:tetratricopeptide (TPR) repeat protein